MSSAVRSFALLALTSAFLAACGPTRDPLRGHSDDDDDNSGFDAGPGLDGGGTDGGGTDGGGLDGGGTDGGGFDGGGSDGGSCRTVNVACELNSECCSGLVCEGFCRVPTTTCSGTACSLGFESGGCCGAAPYCGATTASGTRKCATTCFSTGQRCSGDPDCCSGLGCTNGVCQVTTTPPTEHTTLGRKCLAPTDCADDALGCYGYTGAAAGFCAMNCSVAEDCGANGECANGVCVRLCTANSQCTVSSCLAGACFPDCRNIAGFCGPSLVCDSTSGLCQQAP